MPAMINTRVSFFACIALLGATVSAGAQDLRSYIRPNSHLPTMIGPYMPHHLPAPKLSNSARLDQLDRKSVV